MFENAVLNVAQKFNQSKLSVVSEHLRFLGPKSTRPVCNKPVNATMLITPHFSFTYDINAVVL